MAQTLEMAREIDWARFDQARGALGSNFPRILSYFREDGCKSVTAIEDALRAHDPIGIIGPADLLKSEAVELGALGLAQLAEAIEYDARDCLELHMSPDTMLESVVALRAAFEAVAEQLDRETNPLMVRRSAPPFAGQFGALTG